MPIRMTLSIIFEKIRTSENFQIARTIGTGFLATLHQSVPWEATPHSRSFITILANIQSQSIALVRKSKLKTKAKSADIIHVNLPIYTNCISSNRPKHHNPLLKCLFIISPNWYYLAMSFLKSHFLLDLRNRQTRIQTLRARSRAVENCMTSVQTHAVV